MGSPSLCRLPIRIPDTMNREYYRRDVLRIIGSLPILLTTGAAAATPEDFAAALARQPELIAFETARAEAFAARLTTVHGRLPPSLAGTLWRNGPAEHERYGHRYGHWFDGDALIQAFTFTGAAVTHRARILDTPKRRRETRAGRRILPAFGTIPPRPEPILAPDDMNVANTSILRHAGRLMALWEGGSALAFDPESLTAEQFVAWRADLAGVPFSAHPKVEPDGTLWNIGCVFAPRSMLVFYRIDRAGRLVKINVLPMEPLGMVHDFVVTARHIVALLTPFVLEPERLVNGHASFLDAHVWRPTLGTRVVVINKEMLEPVRRHELPPGFHFHHGNGWDEGDGTLRLDLCQAPNPGFLTEDLRAVMRGEWRFLSRYPTYRHVVLRPGGTATIEDAASGVAEFPRIDSRYAGQRHRRVFTLTGSGEKEGWPLQRVACLHPESSVVDGWSYPRHQIPEEHVFVPRGDAEGDGWLVGPFLDVHRRATGLSVFEARRLADGPLWQGVLPYPLPLGLHGTFVTI